MCDGGAEGNPAGAKSLGMGRGLDPGAPGSCSSAVPTPPAPNGGATGSERPGVGGACRSLQIAQVRAPAGGGVSRAHPDGGGRTQGLGGRPQAEGRARGGLGEVFDFLWRSPGALRKLS